ncbi:hypothetical protein [Chryseobacterium sp. GP-SGM7]|uniref:hypothetical protein n=1 Tax=Chryseobacterium sp. GP-SGM7 TaxID=3411323 RepID=UPI003B9242F5
MIGTLLYRLQTGWQILTGRIKYIPDNRNKNLIRHKEVEPKLLKQISELNIEFIFTEFGKDRVNGGGADLDSKNRLEPSLSGIKKYFPKAKITVYTDFDWDNTDGLNIKKVKSPVTGPDHPRYGYRTVDYFKFLALSEATADFTCALDSDMFFANENIYSLVFLTKKFGVCAAQNVRQNFNLDMRISKDTQPISDESLGNGYSYNQSPMTIWKDSNRGKMFYKNCAEIMQNDPSRASLVMWKSAWKTGIFPYVLPKQFCVCDGDEGCGDEILLHIGHKAVKNYYKL